MQKKAKKEGFSLGFEDGQKQGMQQGIQEGISQGAEQTKIETAKNMILDKLPLAQIAKWTSLPLEEVQKLADELQQSN